MSSPLTLVSGYAFLDAALKSMAVLFMAMIVAALLRRASAAWRHLVWCLSVASLLLLPILSLMLPDWRVACLPQWTAQQAQLAAIGQTELARADRLEPAIDSKITLPPSALAFEAQPPQDPHRLPPDAIETVSSPRSAIPSLTIAWIAGGLLVLVPLILGLWQLACLHRTSQVIDDCHWLTLLHELRRQLALRRRVQLRQCQSPLAPMTWGALRPVLLVPSAAGAWPDERRRLVLLHELAHVLRWDWLTQLVAHMACAVYWFNPLVWWAAKQMRIERERACDDVVLASGVRASDYARELLELAMGLSHSRMSTLVAAPMARRALLDARLRGILDCGRSRSPLTRAAFCLGAVLAAIAITPLAMLRAAPPESAKTIAKEQGTGNGEQGMVDRRAACPELTHLETAELKKKPSDAPLESLEMTVNTSRILSIGKQVPRAHVTDPELVEITALSPTQIQVTAKKPGMTQVNLFDGDDNVYTVHTIVYPDGRELRLSSGKQYPIDLVGPQEAEKLENQGPPTIGDPKVDEIWSLTLEDRARSHNRLPEGDMESLPRMWKAGWRLFQHSQRNLICAGELSVDQHHAGKSSFHLSVRTADEETSSPRIETAPLWLCSPALPVDAGQWVRIHGWVNIPQPITGSPDGLLIIESLGRKPQAERIGATSGWQEFALYRAVPAACDLTVTFALSGVGDAWIDDVTVNLVAPPGSATRQMENEDDVPSAPALVNPEVKEIWDLTLKDAVRSALANSKVLRNIGGLVVTPVVPRSTTNPAGILGAKRSIGDPKATGGTKVRFLLARTNDEVMLAEFKSCVRSILSDVERAYWDLYFNYRNLNAVQAARDRALANWRKVHALSIAGSKAGETEKETLAREQYFLFRSQVENTLGLLYTAESRLRYMMGVAPTDRRFTRPADEPTTAKVRFDLKEIVSEAFDREVQLPVLKDNQELELARVLTNAVRDVDRNYQVSITTGNRREKAAKQLETVQADYDVGMATIDTLLDAQRRLVDAEIAYYRALVDYNVAIMQVHYRKNTLLEYNGILLTEGRGSGFDVHEK